MTEPSSTSDPGTLLNQLVERHWETAARHGWRQYEERGRGAIVFPVAPNANSDEQTPLRYLTFSDPEAAQASSFSKLYELVHEYDPKREIVAAAVLPDERTVFEVYAQDPAPHEA